MLMEFERIGGNFLSDLSLEIGIKNIEMHFKENIKEDTYQKSINQVMKFFKVICDFCDKKYKTMRNGFSGVEAFTIFVSALGSLDIKVSDILDVKKEAIKYYNILERLSKDYSLESEEKKELIDILNGIRNHLDNVTNANENKRWRF